MSRRSLLVPCLVLIAGCVGGARAATLEVNTFAADAVDADINVPACDSDAALPGDQCTLRAAVMQANAAADADTILLPLDQNVSLTLAGAGDLGDLLISEPVTIAGIESELPTDVNDLTSIAGAHGDRLFTIDATGVVLRGLRLTDGQAPASLGGAVRVLLGASVTFDRVRFDDNLAQNGGALFNNGTAEIIASDFSRNRSTLGGAAILNHGSMAIRGSSFRTMRDAPSLDAIGMIRTEAGSTLLIENSTINGVPHSADPTSTGGLVAYGPAQLIIRNSTFHDFTSLALRLYPEPGSNILIANSIFSGSEFADCEVTLAGGADADTVRIGNSLVGQGNCLEFPAAPTGAGVDDDAPILGPLSSVSGSLTLHHTPSFVSQGVDQGQTTADGALGPDFVCLSTDARGTMRPLDGNGIGVPACDMGAIEAALIAPVTYVVNLFDQDLPDPDIGDLRCDVDAAQDGDQCTLRAAVMQANAGYGPDRIEFIQHPEFNEIVLDTAIGPEPDAAIGDLDILEAVVIDGILIDGRPLTTIRQTVGDRLFDIAAPLGQTVRISELRLTGGSSSSGGGAVRVGGDSSLVAIERSEIFGNSATVGGAIEADRRVQVQDSDLHDNEATQNGGAIRISDARLLLYSSSLRDNIASAAVDAESSAIHATDSDFVHIENSTISGNSGGVFADDGTLRINASTLLGNERHAVRVQETAGAVFDLSGSVLAGSDGLDCQILGAVGGARDAANLIEDGSCAGGSNLSGAAGLAPVTARVDGRISRVHLPLPGSAVLDAVPLASPDCPATDQRGRVRPGDATPDDGIAAACDIGAVELSTQEAAITSISVTLYGEDRVDDLPGDGLCDSSPQTGRQCTLRAAVMESNALPGAQTIVVPIVNGATTTGKGAVPVATEILLDIAPEAGPDSAAHGDLDITGPLTIDGMASAQASAEDRRLVLSQTGDRIFDISAAGDSVNLRGLLLEGGDTAGSGGAVRVVNAQSVMLDKLVMRGNVALLGGGAVAALAGEVRIRDSDLDGNGTTGDGAAIRNDVELLLEDSSVRANLDLSATREAIAAGPGSLTTIHNSTLAGNSGDALRVSGGSLAMRNSTVANNEQRGIGIVTAFGQSLSISNSVFHANPVASCAVGGAFAIALDTDRYNFAPGAGCGLDNGVTNLDADVDPLLGALQAPDNRYSAYYRPEPSSPLIDTGSPQINASGCLSKDQLGTGRALDGDDDDTSRCDVGAIEVVFEPLPERIFGSGFESEVTSIEKQRDATTMTSSDR
jgi:hypothetical protein